MATDIKAWGGMSEREWNPRMVESVGFVAEGDEPFTGCCSPLGSGGCLDLI